jgi:hypothetical protein
MAPGHEMNSTPITTSMKPDAKMHVYRLRDGEVVATVVDAEGTLLDVIYFGKFTENQYASLRKVIDKCAIKEKKRLGKLFQE